MSNALLVGYLIVMVLSVAVSGEFEVIAGGLREALRRFPDRVSLVGDDDEVTAPDVVVWTWLGSMMPLDAARIRREHGAERVAIFGCDLSAEVVATAIGSGASGYLSMSVGGVELVEALERIHRGEVVVSRLTR